MVKKRSRIILFAGIGTSPAVLTETVWALAHRENPVVPDEIVAVTTKLGKNALRSSIMSGEPSVWERLKAALREENIAIDGKLFFDETSIRIIRNEDGNEADDLRSGADNLRAADFMLKELRKYTDTDSQQNTTVLCSIAGGRKTMSALLLSCMTLLGREQDKVYHVLIPPDYECGMKPPFYFPQNGIVHQLLSRGVPNGKEVLSAEISIELFEVPFVRMRGLYQGKFRNYSELVNKIENAAPPAIVYPKIEIDAKDGICMIDGKCCGLNVTCFALLYLLLKGIRDSDGLYEMLLKMAAKRFSDARRLPPWFSDFQASDRVSDKEVDGKLVKPDPTIVSKLASDLRKALEKAGCGEEVVKMIAPKGRKRNLRYPDECVSFRGDDFLADICGFPLPEEDA